MRHTFTTQTEHLAGLRAFGNTHAGFAVQGWDFNFTAQSRLGKGQRNGAVQVCTVAFKHRMALDVNFDEQITRLPFTPGSPLPALRMRMPSSIPAGILTSRVF